MLVILGEKRCQNRRPRVQPDARSLEVEALFALFVIILFNVAALLVSDVDSEPLALGTAKDPPVG